jgi:hypothetical protein
MLFRRDTPDGSIVADLSLKEATPCVANEEDVPEYDGTSQYP